MILVVAATIVACPPMAFCLCNNNKYPAKFLCSVRVIRTGQIGAGSELIVTVIEEFVGTEGLL
jgi:hypothetical protein